MQEMSSRVLGQSLWPRILQIITIIISISIILIKHNFWMALVAGGLP